MSQAFGVKSKTAYFAFRLSGAGQVPIILRTSRHELCDVCTSQFIFEITQKIAQFGFGLARFVGEKHGIRVKVKDAFTPEFLTWRYSVIV